MTEFSAWWTTSGTPSGHQQISYTQAQLSTIGAIFAGGSAFEGVLPDYLNELVGSIPGANTYRIGTGGCVCDGKAYENDAAEDVTIPSAVGGGNTRIDRIVIRASWSAFTAEIHRIAGTDAASPVAPSIIQTSGTTYDIMLYQVLVDTAGTVSTQLDERVWASPDVDDSTIELNDGVLRVKSGGILTTHLATDAVETADIKDLNVTSGKLAANAVIAGKIATGGVSATAQLANNIVDNTKAGNRVPMLPSRQGGSATNWATGGTTTRTPTTVVMQCGASSVGGTGIITVTFPNAFSDVPLVVATCVDIGDIASIYTLTSTQATLYVTSHTGAQNASLVFWIAIGPE